MSDTIRDAFSQYLHTQIGLPDATITAWQRITDGWETDVYAYQLTTPDGPQDGILRIFAANSADKARREFAGMTALHNMGYPVPRVSHLCEDASLVGGPFVLMQRIFGQQLGQVMDTNPAERAALFGRFIGLMVDLHRLPAIALPDVPVIDTPAEYLSMKLMQGRWFAEYMGQGWVTPLLDWLEAHPPAYPADARLCIVHNDFHPYNVLTTDERACFVIDWPNIENGDYRADLAWMILLATTYGPPADLRDMILAEYARQAGQPVLDLEAFEVMAATRRLIDLLMTLGRGAEASGLLPETVATMRRQVPHFRQVYGVVQSRSGLDLPVVEAVLAQLENEG